MTQGVLNDLDVLCMGHLKPVTAIRDVVAHESILESENVDIIDESADFVS